MELHHLSPTRYFLIIHTILSAEELTCHYNFRNYRLDDSSSHLLNGSNQSASTLNSTQMPTKPRRNRTLRGRQSSIYIPRNRLSRYKEAVTSILPIRLTQTSREEMPLDSVGCCSNSLFFWTETFVRRAAQDDDQDEFRIPSTLCCDSVDANAKRFLGKFKDQLQKKGSSKLSMFNVIFRFCSTRIVISCFIYLLAILFEVAGIVSFFLSTRHV